MRPLTAPDHHGTGSSRLLMTAETAEGSVSEAKVLNANFVQIC